MVHSDALRRLNPVSGLTALEERVSGLIQAFGFLLGVGAVSLLIVKASSTGNRWIIVGVSIYGGTLLLLYLSSSLYHTVQRLRLKQGLQVVDHMAIYLLIAGTYTPFTLGPLRGPLGWSLFALVWGLALVGIAWKLLGNPDSKRMSVLFYLLMGWACLVAIVPIFQQATWGQLGLVFAGGLVYSLGAVFFALERMPFNQAVWHLFVMGGTACFYLAIWFYVVPS